MTKTLDVLVAHTVAVIRLDFTRVRDSCGFGVPLMRFEGRCPSLPEWAGRLGPDRLAGYRQAHNKASIDGLPGLPVVAPPG